MSILQKKTAPNDMNQSVNKVAIATRLNQYLDHKEWPKYGRGKILQEKLQWTLSQQNKLLSGSQYPTAEMLFDLASHFDINLNWLVTGKGSMFAQINSEQLNMMNDCIAKIMEIADAKNVELCSKEASTFAATVHKQWVRTGSMSLSLIEDLLDSLPKK